MFIYVTSSIKLDYLATHFRSPTKVDIDIAHSLSSLPVFLEIKKKQGVLSFSKFKV